MSRLLRKTLCSGNARSELNQGHPVIKASGPATTKGTSLGSWGRGSGRGSLSALLLLLVHQGLVPERHIVLVAAIWIRVSMSRLSQVGSDTHTGHTGQKRRQPVLEKLLG